MRPPVDRQRIQALAAALSQATTEPTTLYLTDGATAVLEGWRESTVDVDIRLEPDTDNVMRAIADPKDETGLTALDVTVVWLARPERANRAPPCRASSRDLPSAREPAVPRTTGSGLSAAPVALS